MNDWTCESCQNYITEGKDKTGYCKLTNQRIRDMNYCPLYEVYTKEYEEIDDE